ncbi:hypothetical protein CPB86DRAFT_196842 [Serendipita vermifera]|nr:hypothetical protein CPB86DRAFT_196842 [Serendipita vermifera]
MWGSHFLSADYQQVVKNANFHHKYQDQLINLLKWIAEHPNENPPIEVFGNLLDPVDPKTPNLVRCPKRDCGKEGTRVHIAGHMLQGSHSGLPVYYCIYDNKICQKFHHSADRDRHREKKHNLLRPRTVKKSRKALQPNSYSKTLKTEKSRALTEAVTELPTTQLGAPRSSPPFQLNFHSPNIPAFEPSPYTPALAFQPNFAPPTTVPLRLDRPYLYHPLPPYQNTYDPLTILPHHNAFISPRGVKHLDITRQGGLVISSVSASSMEHLSEEYREALRTARNHPNADPVYIQQLQVLFEGLHLQGPTHQRPTTTQMEPFFRRHQRRYPARSSVNGARSDYECLWPGCYFKHALEKCIDHFFSQHVAVKFSLPRVEDWSKTFMVDNEVDKNKDRAHNLPKARDHRGPRSAVATTSTGSNRTKKLVSPY